jgi:hypothetical protein
MARVFISYTREDGREFAETLAAELQGHEAWLDRSELTPGMQWDRELEEAIDRTEVFLPVLTRRYFGARFAPLELARAFRKDKPLIPLRVHADADVSIFLETTQWVDFTNPDARAAALETLREHIGVLAAGGTLGPRDLRAGQWEAVQARTARQTQRALAAAFRPDLYVPRVEAERELARFLDGDAPALLLVGESGAGKSSLLDRLALRLLAEGHAVLRYDCGALPDTEIEEQIARDLAVPLEEVDAEAARAERKLVIVFDSIGDYSGSEQHGAQVLLKRIHLLASRLPGRNVRLISSCNSAAWSRIERGAPLRADRALWYRSGDEPFVLLGRFSDAERDEAYRRYRAAYDLYSELEQLPREVRERLRDPVLLRMTAEVYRGVERDLLPANLGTRIYRTYFEERVSSPAEELLVDELAEAMLAAKSSALSMMELARDERLGPQIVNEDPQSPYVQLLDRGVLQEARGDLRAGIIIRFSHSRVAAYAVARNVYRHSENVVASVESLLAQAAQFPLAWDAAKTLLLLSGDDAALTALAASHSVDQRELAAEALVELHAEDSARACGLLQTLLDRPSEEGRRTALKAAYNLGPEAREFFLRAATDEDESMRESVKNTLYLIWRNESPAGRRSVTDTFYLIWRHAPGFTYELLDSLVQTVSLLRPRRLRSTLEFILDLTITIYINHCEDEQVIERTAALMHELTVKRLHLHRFTAGKTLDGLVVKAFSRIFGGQILEFMVFEAPVQEYFRLPAERRASLSRVADALDPAFDLPAAEDELATLLADPMPLFSGSASLALAVHAAHDFAKTGPLVRRLWERGGAQERLWILAAFSVLLKSTPREWTPLLEELTRRYVDEHREAFLGPASSVAGKLDLVLLPLGLAYGKAGTPMPLFEELLQGALDDRDPKLAARIIAGLAATGFYYPHALFDVFRPAFARLDDEAIANALVTTLATVRTLHIDAVDRFLDEMAAPEAFRHRVNAVADVALVDRYIRVLGYYNNSVHFTLRYPRMRKPLSAGALKLLATVATPYAFIADYTTSALRMLRESRFQLKEWTLPE